MDVVAPVLGILFAVLLVYMPAMTANFIWDDDLFLTANPMISAADGLYQFWFAPKTSFYFPLTSSTFWLEYRLWGMPSPDSLNGYHITNIALHALAAILLWRVLRRLAIPGAWLAAMIFAVHPICVESVAWVAERKNELSQILFFLTLLAYFDFEATNRRKMYVLAVLLFALALLAKTSVVMLPFVLLLVTWWQLGFSGLKNDLVANPKERDLLKVTNGIIGAIGVVGGLLALRILFDLVDHFHAVHENPNDPVIFATHMFNMGHLDREFWFLSVLCIASGILGIAGGAYGWRYNRHLVRLLPFFQVAVLLGVTTVWLENCAIGAEAIPIGAFPSRLANAGMAVWFYVFKVLWPLHLLVIYPRWNIQPPALWEFWGCAALAVLFGICWRYRNGWGKHVLFGFGCFVVTILPAIGLLRMSYMRVALVADHFQYLPMVGLIALIVGGAATLCKRAGSQFRPLFLGVACVVIASFGYLTHAQASTYQGEESLWKYTLAENSDSWQAHNHYGAVLYQKGQIGEAMFHFSEAVRLNPGDPESHHNLGLAYVMKKRADEGIAQFREAVRIKGDEPSMRTNLANALREAHHYDEAIIEYKEALRLNPNDPDLHSALGYTLAQVDRLDEAIVEFQTAVRIAPDVPEAQQNLKAALQQKRKLPK
jgi:tetratricopeptide (TPR) repeat protein